MSATLLFPSDVVFQLNLGRPLSFLKRRRIPSGTGKIWMDDVGCSRNSMRLEDCRHRGWGISNCNHAEDVKMRCSGMQFIDTFECISMIIDHYRQHHHHNHRNCHHHFHHIVTVIIIIIIIIITTTTTTIIIIIIIIIIYIILNYLHRSSLSITITIIRRWRIFVDGSCSNLELRA